MNISMLNDFVRMSKYAGMREDIVQAGGGNSSYKFSETEMVIKASGYQMADVNENCGYVVVNPKTIKNAFLNSPNINDITTEYGEKILEQSIICGEHPSIETFFHAISDVYTLHTHPIVVNILTSRRDGFNILKKLFPEALFVGYETPGVQLAKEYFRQYLLQCKTPGQKFSLVFLKNHGVIVSGRSANEVIDNMENLLIKLEEYLGLAEKLTPYHELTKISNFIEDGVIWRVTDENVLRFFRGNQYKMWQYTFCPDCVVFLGKQPLELIEGQEKQCLKKYHQKNEMASLIIYKNNLFIHASSVKKALEIQSVLSFSAQVMENNEVASCNFLSEEEQDFLLNWDVEKYRKQLK